MNQVVVDGQILMHKEQPQVILKQEIIVTATYTSFPSVQDWVWTKTLSECQPLQPFEEPVKVVASGAELAALPAVMKNLKIELGGKVQQNVQTN